MSQSKMVKLGPGKWSDIHITAAWANTPEKVIWFNIWMRMLADNLECDECLGHAAAYITANPPEKAEDPFIWTWRFHNTVNRRLGKEEMSYETARNLYLEGGIRNCTTGCGGESGQTKSSSETAPATQTAQATQQAQANPQVESASSSLPGTTNPGNLPNILPQTVIASPPTSRKISNTLTYRGNKKKKHT